MSNIYTRARNRLTEKISKAVGNDNKTMTDDSKNSVHLLLHSNRKCFPIFNSGEYVAKLEREYEYMQQSFLALTSHLARIQFSLQQIMQAMPWQRDSLLRELEKIAFKSANQTNPDEMPTVYRDFYSINQIRRKQSKIMNRLRKQTMMLIENVDMSTDGFMCESGKDYDGCEEYDIVDGMRKPRVSRKELNSLRQMNFEGV